MVPNITVADYIFAQSADGENVDGAEALRAEVGRVIGAFLHRVIVFTPSLYAEELCSIAPSALIRISPVLVCTLIHDSSGRTVGRSLNVYNR